MFKSARWRSEKNKIKVVFKLQFHATQVPQVLGNALIISVIPADMGKPTMRLEKAKIQEGSCYWETPIFEMVKLVQDPKTGRISEKIYHFQVSYGSSKTGILGEVSIDFADYIEAIKASSVSLPLKNSKSGAILHISVQRMQENVDQCEVEETENAKVKPENKCLKANLSNGDINGSIRTNSIEDAPCNKATSNKLNINHRVSSGSDFLSSSDSSSGFDTPRELALKNNENEEPISFPLSLNQNSMNQNPTSSPSPKIYHENQRSQWDWSVGSDHGLSTEDSSNDVEMKKLKSDFLALARQAEVSDVELQTIRKQIVKEIKKGQDLLKEVVSLKEERDGFHEECERLKASKNKFKFEDGDPRALVEELRQELIYEKDLNANLRIQLQKTQESNSELILAVQDLDDMLEQKNNGVVLNLSNKSVTSDNGVVICESISKCQTDDDEEQKELEELVKEHNDAKDEYLLGQKIMDLCSEVQIYRRDKDELEMQMEQLALDYEILKQENHDMSYKLEQSQLQEQLKMQYECTDSFDMMNDLETQIENLETELKKQSKELSDSLTTIGALETHVKSLEEELEKQAQGFEEDLESVTHAKVEQEKRAILAEEALRTTRLKNVNTAERLQEEFRKLSMQMSSTFDANEKISMKAFTEASELRMQKNHLEKMLQNADDELYSLREGYEANLYEHANQLNLKTYQIEEMMLELTEMSKEVEIQEKYAEETKRVLSQEMLVLRLDIEKLTSENNVLLEQEKERDTLRVELTQTKTKINEMDMLLQRAHEEKNEIEEKIALVRKEAANSVLELNIMWCSKEENEKIVENLQLQLTTLKNQHNELSTSLFEDELEKNKLRKQVFELKSDIRKKEDTFASIEKKLKDSNRQALMLNGIITHGSKEVTNLKERIKLLEDQIKQRESALETSTNSFLDKEKDLHNKIKEVETRLEDINQSSTILCEDTQKIDRNTEGIIWNNLPEEESDTDNKLSFSKEMISLNQKNLSMEGELKEMQGRYSELSLRFAEVEAERQQLVMRVRNLKNSKKS